MKNILLTGASGFIGSAFLRSSKKEGCRYISVVRKPSDQNDSNTVCVEGIDERTDWSEVLKNINCVVHMAARAHVMNEHLTDPLSAYREVNTAGTLNLARQAAEAGVGRFVFLSSIKVNGESTTGAAPFTEEATGEVTDPYGISKVEAEIGLRSIAEETEMEVVIIRPPLVYGPGVKANFLNLMKLANTGLPLPFNAVRNARSMVYVENLTDFISTCAEHPAAANQTFLVSDGRDLSLPELLGLLRKSMKKPARLFPFPSSLFHLAASLTGKKGLIDRLLGSLQVEKNKADELLAWNPPFSVEEGVEATVTDFLKNLEAK